MELRILLATFSCSLLLKDPRITSWGLYLTTYGRLTDELTGVPGFPWGPGVPCGSKNSNC